MNHQGVLLTRTTDEQLISFSEIIQKLARHFNDEIKYIIVRRGILYIDNLLEHQPQNSSP